MTHPGDTTTDEPSLTYAIGTFTALVGMPLVVFGIFAYLSFPENERLSWGALVVVYLVGTIPGLILGVRYLKTRKSKIGFGISYAFGCLGLLFVEGFLIGCFITDTCL